MSIAKSLSPRRAKLIAQMDVVTNEEITSFIGPNTTRFLPIWEKMRAKARGERTLVWSWCWPAFFFGFAWFMYRKMYAVAAFLFFLPIMLVFFTSSGDTAGTTTVVLAALFGKEWYLNFARAKVRKIKERAASSEEVAEKIEKAGGVSIAGGIVGGLTWLGGLIVIFAAVAAG